MDPSQQPVVEAWRSELQRGLSHLRTGAYEQAEACFERAHRLDPHRPEVCYALGRERMRRGHHEAAERLLRAAWEGDPSLISAAGTLARCLGLHLQRPDDALAVLDQIEAQHGDVGLAHVVRSELLLEQERLDDARHHAEAALACSTDDTVCDAARAALARVHNRDGVDHAESGAHDTALFAFRRAAALDPEWSSPHVNMGAVFARMGRPDLARAAYQQAVAIEPDSAAAHYNLGLLLRDGGDMEAARAALERAIEHSYLYAEATLVLADICLEMDDPEAALDHLGRAIERHPDDPDLWAHLGQALAGLGERDDAEACWRRALDLEPTHAESCHALADLLVRESRFAEAALLVQRARPAADPAPGAALTKKHS